MLIAGIYSAGGYSPANEKHFRAILAQFGIAKPRHIKKGWIRHKTKTSRRERERYIQPIPHDLTPSYLRDGYKH